MPVTCVSQYFFQQDPNLHEYLEYCYDEACKRFVFCAPTEQACRFRRWISNVYKTCFSFCSPTEQAGRRFWRHKTVVGMEAKFKNGLWYSAGTEECTPGEYGPFDFERVVVFLKSQFCKPITVQLGGFEPKDDRGTVQPYKRSFYVGIGKQPEVNVAGWPVVKNESGIFLPSDDILAEARSKFLDVNIIPKWQKSDPTRKTRDLYCKLGAVESQSDLEQKAIEMRDLLAKLPPVYVEVCAETMAVVRYVDNRLPPHSSTMIPVCNLTPGLLSYLFNLDKK